MSEQTSLDDILSDTPEKPVEPSPAEAAPEAVESAEPQAERPKSLRKQHREREEAARAEGDGKIRDPESGKFVAKTEEQPKTEEPAKVEAKPEVKPAEQPAQEMTAKERALLAAAADERRKRQELEQRLAALQQQPKEEPKPFWDDPENAMKTFEKKLEDVAINTRFNTSELIARSKYQDFEEKLGVFGELLKQTPGLHQQWVAAPDPAEFAYNIGKNHLQIQQVGSIDALLKKNEEEVAARVRAQLEAEYKAKAEEAQKARAAIPPSLSDARGTAVNRTVWSGPTSLDDILKG